MNVIILYQSLGVDPYWLLIWGAIWFTSFLCFVHLRFVITKSTLHDTEEDVKQNKITIRQKLGLILNFLVFAGMMGASVYYIAKKEESFHHIDVYFFGIQYQNIVCIVFVLLFNVFSRFNKAVNDKTTEAQFTEIGDNALSKIYHFFAETNECNDYKKYGNRINFRRLLLLLGVLLMGYEVISSIRYSLNVSVKQEVVDLIADLNISLTFPTNGTTIFDDAFRVYGHARNIKIYMDLASWIFFILAIIIDWIVKSNTGIGISRFLSCIGTCLLLIGIIAPAIPNYLRDSHIQVFNIKVILIFKSITPHCAPKFDQMVYSICLDVVGVAGALLFTVQLGALMLSIPLSIVRGGALILLQLRSQKRMKFIYPSLKILWVLTSMLAPISTMLPCLVFYQLLGDYVVATFLSFYWIAPIIVSVYGAVQPSLKTYVLWVASYSVPLFGLLIYELVLHGGSPFINAILKSPETWFSMLAEVFLSLVVVTDLIFIQM